MKTKTILLNNDSDYNKLIKKLNLYKSILYINTHFQIKNNINKEDIEYIINALNIKNRKKRIEYIYNQSCEIIDSKKKDINMCGFKKGICYAQRKKLHSKCNGCCRRCIYQTNNGCSTQNLSCKLFNCSEVTKRYDVITYKDLNLLKILSLKNKCIIKSDYFSSKEDVLKDLYSHSILYATIRIVYRLIKSQIYLSKPNKKTLNVK